ncbi:toluene hydroxylase [Frankia sp. R43]|uniref:toluene hydroxylase n=1 Tax=Frankia sp. R43 TaxID=269536 RepID=UPI0006CA4469|nr:toluene hydroxylase [Frankia sp. R43]KPM55980.1 toluene hydroxylase [Frankia sp. R43]
MTNPQATPRSRQRALKTWSAFGNLGRRPTEYEILTHGLNHTTGRPVPLEMGPDVHGNVWLREHRDATRLRCADWDAFRDPDAMTYGKYVAQQDDQETYVEGLLEQFEREDHDATLGSEAVALLRRALAPSRYLAHGQQMLSAYLQQLASSSYVANCAAFQTADQLRRVQLTAYRTTQLRSAHPRAGFATGERQDWEGADDWQPIRRAVELALVEFDWDRAFVVTNLVVKPVADLLTLSELGRQCAEAGARLDALILENLWIDAQRGWRWTAALTRFLLADEANREVLQGHLDEFAPLGDAMAGSGGRLLATGSGRDAAEIAAAVRTRWGALLAEAGLATAAGPGAGRL